MGSFLHIWVCFSVSPHRGAPLCAYLTEPTLKWNSKKIRTAVLNLENFSANLLSVACLLPAMRTKRIFFKIALIFLSIGIPHRKIDLAFQNINIPNVYLCHALSALWQVVFGQRAQRSWSLETASQCVACRLEPCCFQCSTTNHPPAFRDRCVAASLMCACNYNTSPQRLCSRRVKRDGCCLTNTARPPVQWLLMRTGSSSSLRNTDQ